MNIGKGILIDILRFDSIVSFFLLLSILVLIQKRILQICDSDTVSLEEPSLKFLDHSGLEGSYIFIQLNNVISELLDFLHFQLVVPFTCLLFFHHLKLFFINNIFRKLLLSFTILFSFQVSIQLSYSILLSLSLLGFKFNFLFLGFEFFYVFQNTVIYLKTYSCFELLIGFIFINVDYFSLRNYFFLWASLGLGLFIFKLIFRNVNQVRNIFGRLSIFNSFARTKSKSGLLNTNFPSEIFRLCFVLSFFFRLFLLMDKTVITNIFNRRTIDIFELYKKFSYLS